MKSPSFVVITSTVRITSKLCQCGACTATVQQSSLYYTILFYLNKNLGSEYTIMINCAIFNIIASP